MNTVQSVFDLAIRLMDAQNESTGSTDTADTKEYRLRTPSLINILLDQAYLASDTLKPTLPGKRPICQKVIKMEDELDLDERLCTGVMPYGLAALLLTEEDPARADFFWQTYLEQLREARISLPSQIAEIENVYGGIELGQFSHW